MIGPLSLSLSLAQKEAAERAAREAAQKLDAARKAEAERKQVRPPIHLSSLLIPRLVAPPTRHAPSTVQTAVVTMFWMQLPLFHMYF